MTPERLGGRRGTSVLRGRRGLLGPAPQLRVSTGWRPREQRTRLGSPVDLPSLWLLLAPLAQVGPEGHNGSPGPLRRQPPGFLWLQGSPAGVRETAQDLVTVPQQPPPPTSLLSQARTWVTHVSCE